MSNAVRYVCNDSFSVVAYLHYTWMITIWHGLIEPWPEHEEHEWTGWKVHCARLARLRSVVLFGYPCSHQRTGPVETIPINKLQMDEMKCGMVREKRGGEIVKGAMV